MTTKEWCREHPSFSFLPLNVVLWGVMFGAVAAILQLWGENQEIHREDEADPCPVWAANQPGNFLLQPFWYMRYSNNFFFVAKVTFLGNILFLLGECIQNDSTYYVHIVFVCFLRLCFSGAAPTTWQGTLREMQESLAGHFGLSALRSSCQNFLRSVL